MSVLTLSVWRDQYWSLAPKQSASSWAKRKKNKQQRRPTASKKKNKTNEQIFGYHSPFFFFSNFTIIFVHLHAMQVAAVGTPEKKHGGGNLRSVPRRPQSTKKKKKIKPVSRQRHNFSFGQITKLGLPTSLLLSFLLLMLLLL